MTIDPQLVQEKLQNLTGGNEQPDPVPVAQRTNNNQPQSAPTQIQVQHDFDDFIHICWFIMPTLLVFISIICVISILISAKQAQFLIACGLGLWSFFSLYNQAKVKGLFKGDWLVFALLSYTLYFGFIHNWINN
jgi:hypothetical protein